MADRAIEHPGRADAAERRPYPLPWLALASAQRTALALFATIALVFVVQTPVLGHYFFNDDFVPLADIASRSTGGYIKDLFLLRDLTPNWRFLTGVFYLVEYRAFQLHALPYLLIAVLFHTATAGLIFWLMRRATKSDWAAIVAAGFFGMSAATVPTVGQVTALNNVLAGFFVTLSIVLLVEALDRERLRVASYILAVVAFALAIASNESASVTAPVLGLIVVWKAPRRDGRWQQSHEWAAIALYTVPFVALGSAALIGFGTCGCTEAELYSRGNIIDNVWLYFGRLLYPIGLEFPGHVGTAHLAAGFVVFGLAALALIRGPALARIATVFLFLAVAPYLPIDIWAAQRYTYLASIPFAILAAFFILAVGRYATRISPALAIGVVALAVAAVALNGWQTIAQNADQADASDRWRQLVTAVDTAYPDVPPRSTVYVRGGPIVDELAQCSVMPAIGEVLWGDAKLFTLPVESQMTYRARPGYAVYVGEFAGGRIVPQTVPLATNAEMQSKDIILLPHIAPDASGNVCRLDLQTFP